MPPAATPRAHPQRGGSRRNTEGTFSGRRNVTLHRAGKKSNPLLRRVFCFFFFPHFSSGPGHPCGGSSSLCACACVRGGASPEKRRYAALRQAGPQRPPPTALTALTALTAAGAEPSCLGAGPGRAEERCRLPPAAGGRRREPGEQRAAAAGRRPGAGGQRAAGGGWVRAVRGASGRRCPGGRRAAGAPCPAGACGCCPERRSGGSGPGCGSGAL